MSIGRGISGHHSTAMGKDEWLTPPEIVTELGPFDLDPCAPIVRPWDTAARHYTVQDDGLSLPWEGRVWCNPPYGLQAAAWLRRCVLHRDAVALIFARTETVMFFQHVWDEADAVLFLRGRLFFHHVSGEKAKNGSGGPSVLVAYGDRNADALYQKSSWGRFIKL
jgi:hypothetical protein